MAFTLSQNSEPNKRTDPSRRHLVFSSCCTKFDQVAGDCLSPMYAFTIWAADVGMICFRSLKDEFDLEL